MRSKPTEEELAAKSAETRRRIELAQITYSDCADIPGVRIARWTDHNGDTRVSLYFGKQEEYFGYYSVQISDYQGGSFAASTAISDKSVEDAVANWIASWW